MLSCVCAMVVSAYLSIEACTCRLLTELLERWSVDCMSFEKGVFGDGASTEERGLRSAARV